MTEFFRSYFAISSQGGDPGVPGRFLQAPMFVSYANKPEPWKVYPFSFPSYRLSNDNFAPMWRIDCQVVEAPTLIKQTLTNDALERINKAIGFTPGSPFNDPLLTWDEFDKISDQIISNFKGMLPDFTEGQLMNMIWQGISRPVIDPITRKLSGAGLTVTGPAYRSSTTDPSQPGSGPSIPALPPAPPGVAPTGTVRQLAQQILTYYNQGKISGDQDQFQAIADGKTLTNQCGGTSYPTQTSLDQKLLQQIIYLINGGFNLIITALVSDHKCVCAGCDHPSPHSLGQGVDIGSINGHNIGSENSSTMRDLIIQLIDYLATSPIKPSQIICDGMGGVHDDQIASHDVQSDGSRGPYSGETAAEHRNHIHITSS